MKRALVVLLALLIAMPLRAGIVSGPSAIIPAMLYRYGLNTPTTTTLDATTDRTAWIFTALRTCTLKKIRFALATTTTAAGSTLRACFENVDLTTGMPDDTCDQYRVTGAVTAADNSVIETGIMTDDGTDTGAKRSVTVGDLMAITLKYESFTAADTLQVRNYTDIGDIDDPLIYRANNLTGAYAKSATSGALTLYCDDDTVAATGHPPAFTTGSTGTNFNNGSTPDARGVSFSLPWPATITGAAMLGLFTEAVNLYLYTPSAKTLLFSYDPDVRPAASTYWMWARFSLSVDAGTTYILAWEPQGGTNITVYAYGAYSSNEETKAWKTTGTWQLATAKDPALSTDFTVTAESVPVVAIEVSALHDGTGTGSMIFVPVE